jgi:hypothetical protein
MLSDLAGKKLSTPQDTEKRRKAASEEPSPTSQTNSTPRRRKAKTPSPAENNENSVFHNFLSIFADIFFPPRQTYQTNSARNGERRLRTQSRF